ncbi:MAG: hypothetical protein ACK4PI_01210 [Tepidisphaerales bacterium]
MTAPSPSPTPQRGFTVPVDLTNPGQFFACCGLLEVADRLYGHAEGWFEGDTFHVACSGTLPDLLQKLAKAELTATDPDNTTACPLELHLPTHILRLDWWTDQFAGGAELKTWAGSMDGYRIAQAMQRSLIRPDAYPDPFNSGTVCRAGDSDDDKKVEPFYFDARRAGSSDARDIGFSPNDLQRGLETIAYPAVEFLTLVGLQRFRPAPGDGPRLFLYATWAVPLPAPAAQTVVQGIPNTLIRRRYLFENWFRTSQRKHKAFRRAQRIQ